jgi:glycerophosphoryl diester phosphodiesterase
MIIGHRGGLPFGPYNTMKAFRGAVEAKLEGIEFDVWLSKDNVPMITHGGNNG